MSIALYASLAPIWTKTVSPEAWIFVARKKMALRITSAYRINGPNGYSTSTSSAKIEYSEGTSVKIRNRSKFDNRTRDVWDEWQRTRDVRLSYILLKYIKAEHSMVILFYRDINGTRIFIVTFTSLREIRIAWMVPYCSAVIDDSRHTLFEWTLKSKRMGAE